MRSTRVAVVDAQPIFRAGVRGVLEETGRYAVISQTSDGLDGGGRCRPHEVDLLVIGLPGPDASGRSITELRGQYHSNPLIVVLAQAQDDETRRRLARAGAAASLPRDISAADLVSTLDRVVAGENLLAFPLAEPAPGERFQGGPGQ